MSLLRRIDAPHARAAAGLAVVALASLTLLLRLPPALSGLSQQAKRNDAYTAQGRLLAAADSLAIDNGFVLEALQALPERTTFAVLAPSDERATQLGISQITTHALPGFLRMLLLPRREVSAGEAQYFLCYACDTGPWRGVVRWTWSGPNGELVGRRKAGA